MAPTAYSKGTDQVTVDDRDLAAVRRPRWAHVYQLVLTLCLLIGMRDVSGGSRSEIGSTCDGSVIRGDTLAVNYEHPGGEHDQVPRVEQYGCGDLFALSCFMFAVFAGIGAVTVQDDAVPRVAWIIAAALLAVITVCYYLLNRYFRYLRRRLRRLTSTPPATPVWRPPPRPDTGSTRQQLRIRFRRPPTLDDPAVQYRQICTHTNVMDKPPLHIAYFRSFTNPARNRTFREGAWNEFGYVHQLRNPDSATWRELWRSRTPETMAELVVSTETQLRDRLQRAPTEPEWRSTEPYGGYPLREFFCGDSFWQQAAGTLIALADLVVIDLSGHTPESLGLRFELEHAFATKPLDQILVLADELSDRDYLATQIRQAWPGSSTISGPAVVRAYILDKVEKKDVTAPSTDPTQVILAREIQLHSDRSESRRLLQRILR